MAPIGLAAAAPEAIVGRLAGDGGDLVADRPVQVKRDGQDFAVAVDAKGVSRRGRPADVRTGVHWMLTKAPQGGFVLQRVGAWYEFEKPSAAPTTLLVGRPQAKEGETAGASARGAPAMKKVPQSVPTLSAEAELKLEANKRKEFSDRWDRMQGRREGRQGVRVKFGDIIKTKTDEKADGPKRKVEHPEEERVNDETGISKQKKKKAKQLKKEANAVDQAEEDDVPETANTLLKLKHQRGEAGWDFSDEEAFSDDEQEKQEFEGGAIARAEEVDEAVPSGDEDEGEDAEKGDLLSSHGKQLEVLIQNFNEEDGDKGAGDLSGEEDAPDDEDAPDNEVMAKAETVDGKRRRVSQEQQEYAAPAIAPSASSTPVTRAPAASLAPTTAAAPKAPGASAMMQEASSASSASAALAVRVPAAPAAVMSSASSAPASSAPTAAAAPQAQSVAVGASSSTAPATSHAVAGQDSAYAKLRQETIQCIRQQGGFCTLKQLTAVMSLKNTKSERYKNVTLILKEVAALKMDPSTNKPVLKLLPEHRQ